MKMRLAGTTVGLLVILLSSTLLPCLESYSGTIHAADSSFVVSVVSDYDSVVVGQSFSVNVSVANMPSPGLYAYELELHYNTAILTASAGLIPSDHFLKPVLDANNIDIVDLGTVNPTGGSVSFAASLISSEPGKTGSGTLATVTFTAVTTGNALFVIRGYTHPDPLFIDPNAVVYPSTAYTLQSKTITVSSPSVGPTILVSEEHHFVGNNFESWYFEGLRALLAAQGYQLIVDNSPITESILSGVDVLLVFMPTEQYGTSEIDAIENFVLKGGGLFCIADIGITWRVDDIIARWGFSQASGTVTDSNNYVDNNVQVYYEAARGNFAVHGITSGLTRVQSGASNWLEALPSNAASIITTDTDGTSTPGGVSIYAALDTGTGRIAISMDSDCFSGSIDGSNGYLDADDNALLALNTFVWLMGGHRASVDLSVSSPDMTFSDSNPAERQSVTISATVHNVGDTNLENIVVRFLDGSTVVGERQIPVISHRSQGTASIDWVAGNAGFHLIKVIVDPYNAIIEDNEHNDEATRSVFVGTWQQGGISLTGDLTPTETNPCCIVEVSGEATYSTTYGAGEPVAGADITVSINGNQWTTNTIADGTYKINVAAPPSPGSYSVVVTITDYTFWESISLNLKVDSTGGLDLALSFFDIAFSPTSPVKDNDVLITATVHNVGTEDVSNIPVAFYDGAQLIGEATISLLPTGSSGATGISWLAKPSGWHTITVEIDPQNEMPETNELNNDASKRIYVYPSLPDLTPTSIFFSDNTPLVNRDVTLATRVVNIGGVYAFDVTVSFYDDGAFIGEQTIPSIPPRGEAGTAQITSSFSSVGWHNVAVVVDPENAVAEADEGNNGLSAYVFVRLPSVDLALSGSDITFSNSAPTIGDTVMINAAVHNIGEVDASDVVVEFLGIGRTTIALIPAGSSQVTSLSWNAAPAGLHWIVVMADPDNAISESNENNNVASRFIYVSPPPSEPLPDLAVHYEDIVFSDANPVPGEKVAINVAVHNVGTASAQDIPVVLYVDSVQIGSVHIIPWLSPSQSTTIATSWTASSTGTHTVEVRVDPWYSIAETSKSNNDASKSIYVYPSLPDLAPTSIFFSDRTPLIGQSITLSTNVQNLGGVGASNVAVRFYDADNSVETVTIPSVGGKGAAGTAEIALSFASAGWHDVTVVVDLDNNIAEADETNNRLSVFVFVRPPLPDLTLSSSDVTFSNFNPTDGDVIIITAQIHNIGEVDASDVVVEFFGIGRTTISLIPAGASQTTSVSWTATPAGWHRIVVIADPDNAISESDENNNVASRGISTSPPGPPPDLSILSSDIVFSNTNPMPGEKVTIYATIHNVGQGQASDVMAIFYLDKNTPLDTQTVASIPPGDSQNVAVEWTATQSGSHVVTVLVDTPADSNENNNMATRAIIVPSIPEFEILVSPKSRSVLIGDSVKYETSLLPKDGFDSEVFLDLQGYPDGTSFSFLPSTITPGVTSTLTITTSHSAQLATSTLTVIGTGGGLTRRSEDFRLRVILLMEVEVKRFAAKRDLVRPFFNLSLVGSGEEFRSPQDGNELPIARADEAYPGPLYIPVKDQPSFPIDIEIKAFHHGLLGVEEIGIGHIIVEGIEGFPRTEVFQWTDMYARVDIRTVKPIRVSDSYFPSGTTEELTPGLANEWHWFAVGADEVWKNYAESDFHETVVAILDTGVNYTYPALENVMWINVGETGLDGSGRDKRTNGEDDDQNGYTDDWRGWDFVARDNDPDDEGGPWQDGMRDFHGTEIAGIIAAQVETGYMAGIAAVMKTNLKIMPLRVIGTSGHPDQTDIAKGIEYAMDKGADIISMSFGIYEELTQRLRDDIDRAYKENGVLLVASAGNERSMRKHYPSSYESVLSVSGTKEQLSYVRFANDFILSDSGSNYGPELAFQRGVSVEVCAPSEIIWTTSMSVDLSTWQTRPVMGTSYAAPIAAAISAMVIGYASQRYGRALNPAEIRSIIRDSSLDLGASKWDPYYGYGLVNAYSALKKVDEVLGNKNWQITLDPNMNLDLHLYDSLGRHVGLNYTSGQTEIDIPGAIYTGDESGGFETIFLPLEITQFRIEIVGTEVIGLSPYTLEVLASDEIGGVLPHWDIQGNITQGSVDTHHVYTPPDSPPILDDDPPSTRLTIGNPCYNTSAGTYVTGNTPFTLGATDGSGSGVASTAYRIRNTTWDSDWITYSVPPIEFYLTGIADGEYFIDFYSVDNIGNTETTITQKIIIDNTPPTTTLTIGDPKYISDKTYVTPDTPFTLTAADVGSGVNLTTYRITIFPSYDSGWLTYTKPFNLASLTEGAYTIEYNSTDNVQNIETTHTVNVTLSAGSIFEDGFEYGNFNAWSGTNSSIGETATVATTLKHHGTYSGRFTSNGGGGTEYSYCYKNIVSSSEVYTRGYFYVSQTTLRQDGSRFFFIIFTVGGNQLAFAGVRRTSGVPKWTLTTRNGTRWIDVFSSTSPSRNRWYCVELHWRDDSVNGLTEMYVDGKLVCSSYGINTAAFGGVSQVQVGLAQIMYCGTTTVYCDCAKIATTYIGPETSKLTVTSPNGGESWVRSTTHQITWTSIGSVGSYVKIEILKSGVVKGAVTTANDGSYSWTIGSSHLGIDYKVRITSTSNPSITDTSDNYFSITADGSPGTLTVTSPNGGESWVRGSTHAITWTSTGSVGSYVKIELLKGEVVKGSLTTANDGSYSWTIGSSHLGTDYRIRITSTSNLAITDSSDSDFTITS